jgi:Tetratricopeptide repeat.
MRESRIRIFGFFLCTPLLFGVFAFAVVGQKRSVTVVSEPGAIVWVDDVRFGRTGKDGKFEINSLPPGKHIVRVRADGFTEISKPLLPAPSGEFQVTLTKTVDKAELAFQEAERLSAADREQAVSGYRNAIKLRPGYAQAYIGLARVLSETNDIDGAQKTIRELRRTHPANAEASAIEGRIYKDAGDEAKAIASFKRAIAEGKGFQPEAYTGLGLLYKEKAEGFGGEGNFDEETANYNEAAKNLKIALKQLSGAPDASVLYQLLGLVYERQKKYNEAIGVYEEFLKLFPNSNDAPAVQSFIVQLKKQMEQ